MINPDIAPEVLAQRFHETYERLAPQFQCTLVHDEAGIHLLNRGSADGSLMALMVAVCAELLATAVDAPVAAPAQQAIGWGDYFSRIDSNACTVEFGRVVTEDVLEAEPWVVFNYVEGWRAVVISGSDGERRRLNVHVSALSPLTLEQFEIAQSFRFDTASMGSTPEGRKVLVAVFTQPAWEGDRT